VLLPQLIQTPNSKQPQAAGISSRNEPIEYALFAKKSGRRKWTALRASRFGHHTSSIKPTQVCRARGPIFAAHPG
jgi:hypothetical protein